MVKTRCVQLAHSPRKPEVALGFEGTADTSGADAVEAMLIGSVTGQEPRDCALKAKERHLRLEVFRRRPPRRFPFRKRGPSRPGWFRDVSRCIASFLLPLILCRRRRPFAAASAAALPVAIGFSDLR